MFGRYQKWHPIYLQVFSPFQYFLVVCLSIGFFEGFFGSFWMDNLAHSLLLGIPSGQSLRLVSCYMLRMVLGPRARKMFGARHHYLCWCMQILRFFSKISPSRHFLLVCLSEGSFVSGHSQYFPSNFSVLGPIKHSDVISDAAQNQASPAPQNYF